MAENRDQNEIMENKAAEKLAEALGEDIGEIPEVSITVEELKKLEQADRKKRNRKRANIVGIAAALILVCGVAAFAAWPKMAAPVDADKNTQQSVEEENGVVVINENGAEGESAVTTVEKNWDKVKDLRKDFPELMIPSYVPEGYEFVEVKIEQDIKIGYHVTYIYKKQELELQIEEDVYREQGESAPTQTDTEHQFETKQGTAYISDKKNENLNIITLYWNDKRLTIRGDINKNESKAIINEIDMP